MIHAKFETPWLRPVLLILVPVCFMVNARAQKLTRRLTAKSKPNIVFILADDVGYYVPAINGGVSYSTPRIDSMARHGMNFTHCEATPLCATSRCMLLTGKYNMRNYSNWGYMNGTDKTLANLMKDAGYTTAIFGKHQLEYSVDTMKNWGWDHHVIFELTENKMKYSRYKNPVLMEDGTVLQGAAMKDKYGDDVLTEKIFDFINAHKSEPFFVYYSMSIGHAPYCPTPDDPEYAGWNPDKGTSDPSFFGSMMHYMDKKVGQILDSLQKMGLGNNTLVLFAGDNGTPPEVYYDTKDEQHIRGEKGTPREGGTHVPFVAYWPGQVKAGSVNDDLIDFSDFFPTFAQAAGVTSLGKYGILDGISFYNAMLSKPHTAKQQLFMEWDQKPGFTDYRRWARDKVYKLYDSTDENKPRQFLNMVLDEKELKPISNAKLTSQEKIIKQQLQKMLDTIGTWPEAPVLQTPSAKNITSSSASLSATIASSGASALTDRGSTLAGPDQLDPYLQVGRMHDTIVKTGAFTMQRKGLSPQLKYRYSLYAINKNQAHSTGFARDSFYTLSNPPVQQPASFTASSTSGSITLTWGKAKYPAIGAKNAGYLLIYSAGNIQINNSPNGKTPVSIVEGGTIVPITSTVLPKVPVTTIKVNGLSPGTAYHFILIPYTWNGSVAATYDYLTQNALTLTKATTTIVASTGQPAIKVHQVVHRTYAKQVNTTVATRKL